MTENTPANAGPAAPATEPRRLTDSDLALVDALGGAATALNALRKLPEDHPARTLMPEADALLSRLCEFPVGSTMAADTESTA